MLDQIRHILSDLPAFLDGFVLEHGVWVYALLFAIIFVETGLVIMPFLPGDSLLFAVGAISARGSLNVWLIALVLIVAAILGDAVNYHIGKWLGPKVFRAGADDTLYERMLNRKHLARAHDFFEKYGGKAVILARFVPIVRTFIPFVAGAGAMTYSKFFLYNVVGAVAWVALCVGAGYAFGNVEFVKRNFEAVLVAIVVVSCVPMAVEFVLARRRTARAALAAVSAEVPK
jgi:membrane-associated protein